MADQEEPHSLASTFPNPPPFWKEFTSKRAERIEELRDRHLEVTGQVDKAELQVVRIPDLPHDLVNLQPPAEPTDGRWRVFGDLYTLDDKLPTLEDQGILSLPSTLPASQQQQQQQQQTTSSVTTPYNRALELKRLSKSLLLNFLELAGTLSHSPSDSPAKVDDLRTIFINMHHVINEYRPHQARESAIEMMGEHLDKIRGETRAVREVVDRAGRVLEGLGSLGVGAGVEASLKGQIAKDVKDEATEETDKDAEAHENKRLKEMWDDADALLT